MPPRKAAAAAPARPARKAPAKRATAKKPAAKKAAAPRAKKTTAPPPEAPRYGNVETKVRADVAALTSTHPMAAALAEMAYTLARTLDEGAGLAVAAVNRELRANLVELARLGVADDEDLDAALSTPVRDAEEPGPRNARSRGRRGGAPPR